MKTEKEVQKFYNVFAKKQAITGTNLRHYTIINHLMNYGLKKNHNVLEIGCGIGTLTKLIYRFLNKGELVATDISDESIQIAKTRITTGSKDNMKFFVTDMKDFNYPKKFDFIVLPDVLEHIPIEQHPDLFSTLSRHMHEKSIILIHIPHPTALDFIREHEPEKLQIIDQSINADVIINNSYANNLFLIDYISYSLYNNKADYVLATFKKGGIKYKSNSPLSKLTIIYKKTIARIKFLIRKLFI